jgi:polar amino acid transport system permease protein
MAMVDYTWDFQSVIAHFNVLLQGLLMTLQLAGISLTGGFILGLFVAIARMSRHRLASWPASTFIEVFRNTPVLVQLLWFFYAFPLLIGVQMTGFAAAVLALSLNTTAFSAELYRGGIQSIDPGQSEAGRALGMSRAAVLRRIVLPQAIKHMLPALTSRAIELTKMTALASTIAVSELLYQARLVSSVTFQPIETFTLVALIYFVILVMATQGAYALERRLNIHN